MNISGALGVTFNGENPATDYKTGTEFHLEGAISQYLVADLNVGLTGYYYNQLTGDSGRAPPRAPSRARSRRSAARRRLHF